MAYPSDGTMALTRRPLLACGAGIGSGGCTHLVRLWRVRSRTRGQLARLGADQLGDVGVDRDMQRREASKWFWQA